MLLNEALVVGVGVDAGGWLVDGADEDGVPCVQDSQLLQTLCFLHAGPGQLGKPKKELAAIGVESNVLMEHWGFCEQ